MTDTEVVPRKPDRPDVDPPLVDEQLADELLARAQAQGAELLGPDGLLSQVTKAVRALGEELTGHLGYDKHDPAGRGSGNSRNGSTPKRLLTEVGGIDLDVPRDRNGSFAPQIVRKGQTRLDGFNDRIIALYARGMSTRDIRAHLREMYAVDVSPDLISRVTDAVVDELQEWQSRPLDRVYPVVFVDALMVKIRDGVVANRPVYLAIGIDCDGAKNVLGMWSARRPANPRSSGLPCCPSSRAAAWPTCASSAATGSPAFRTQSPSSGRKPPCSCAWCI
jgi:putative transposase